MKKQTKPNLQFMLQSTISALQVAYKDYKTAVIKDLQSTWYSNDGVFTFLAGEEERKKKITDLGKEVVRLQFEVDKIKTEIEEGSEEE